ncbi:hypothetical protein TNIN_363341 [Trichonephila inaurata madagascariensis]|uniref:Uncharacterized protein n=1 Tax=Trichonephila inaurata madagascariensis TaxID=2747483 RepID=A0A8X7C865_9ARAC|nr:hypothetical protein TNIN_363341 [Trichonephila inaurata madagascariensis]
MSLNNRLRYIYRGKPSYLDAIVVGSLGTWDPANDTALHRLGISRKYATLMRKLICSDTIRWSRDICIEHLTDKRSSTDLPWSRRSCCVLLTLPNVNVTLNSPWISSILFPSCVFPGLISTSSFVSSLACSSGLLAAHRFWCFLLFRCPTWLIISFYSHACIFLRWSSKWLWPDPPVLDLLLFMKSLPPRSSTSFRFLELDCCTPAASCCG